MRDYRKLKKKKHNTKYLIGWRKKKKSHALKNFKYKCVLCAFFNEGKLLIFRLAEKRTPPPINPSEESNLHRWAENCPKKLPKNNDNNNDYKKNIQNNNSNNMSSHIITNLAA